MFWFPVKDIIFFVVTNMAGNHPELTLKTFSDVTLTNVGTLRSPVKRLWLHHPPPNSRRCESQAINTWFKTSQDTFWRNDNDDTYKYEGIRRLTGLSSWFTSCFEIVFSLVVDECSKNHKPHLLLKQIFHFVLTVFSNFLPTRCIFFPIRHQPL